MSALPDPLLPDERELCLRVLQRIADDPALIDTDERFKALIAKIHRLGRKEDRRISLEEKRVADGTAKAQTSVVRAQAEGAPHAGNTDVPLLPSTNTSVNRLLRPTNCYVCKRPFTELHFFYHQLCPECASLNYARRQQCADLTGRVALITGGRIKIGYQITLRLLRDGARVLVTTRFPADARRRLAAEPDAADWLDRLTVYGLDLRNLPTVEAFCDHLLASEPHLDILIHNAAQTVKRPLDFYAHLLEGEENTPLLEAQPRYPALAGEKQEANIAHYFPPGLLDSDGQQIDRRPENSWSQRLGEVNTVEALEVHLVNAVAPFVLTGRLRPLLARSPFPRRFVVGVSAMEGQFGRETKTAAHPHTNMAKAALNMLTRTSAQDLRQGGIYLNSVDTGWITDENPWDKKGRMREEQNFFCPLDVIDGAARVYDPVARGVNEPEEPLWGLFLKDYAPHPW